jgi:predicted aconitase
MLRLADDDRRMLGGEYGAFRQRAMAFNVGYAKVLGAEEMCPVSRATLFIGAQHYLDCYAEDLNSSTRRIGGECGALSS